MNSSTSKQRNRHIYLRVSDHEKRAIGQRADKAGLTVSEFIRSAAENVEVVSIDIGPLLGILRELRSEGVNVNQLTKLAHQGKLRETELESLNRTLARMRRCYAHVSECLISIREEADKHHLSIKSEAAGWDRDPDEIFRESEAIREAWERPTLQEEAELAREASEALANRHRAQ